MNSFRKSQTTNITRRESLETMAPVINGELLNLQFTNKKKEVINEYVVKRKAELLDEMKQEQIHQEYDQKTEIQKLKALLAEVRYHNDQMKLNLNQYSDYLPEEKFVANISQINLDDINNQIDAEQDQNKALQDQIQSINHSLRKKEKYNNTLKEQLGLYTQKQPQIQLKQYQNKQAFDVARKQNKKIKQALSTEKDWQNKYLYENTQNYEQKNQIVKENLENLCSQEERLQFLQMQLEETEKEIESISQNISTKFHKIEECAEFLDELDDFDKLTLIFVMEDPQTFELPEILENAKFQLSRPKNRMQIADSEQEYIDRARFSSVSSRMRIFLKFHKNDLDKSVDDLIQVYRKLQFSEMTLKNRYEDLLDQKAKLKSNLENLNALEFYPLDDILFERGEEHMNVEEVNVEAALVSKNQQTRLVEYNAQFLIRMYSMLTNTFFRMVNSLLNIKEVLKTCPSEQFDQDFYLKWTYNKLFQKLGTIQEQLENQFKIKIIVKDPAIRNSNQLLNAIYDHLEERPIKRKTLAPLAPKQTMQDVLADLNQKELISVQETIQSDVVLAQFFGLIDLQNLICQVEQYDQDQLVQLIKTEGYNVALQNARRQLKYLLNYIEEAVLDCRNIHEQQNSSKLIQQKYKLQDLMEKHINSYEFKPREWKKELLETKIKQLQPINGHPFDEPPTPNIEQNTPLIVSQPSSPNIQPVRSCRTEQSPNQIKRFIISIDSSIPNCSQSQANQLQSDPIFIHLHHMNRKIKNQNRSQTQQKVNQPHPQAFEVFFSKKSVELSRDSMTNLQLKSTPIQTNRIILRTSSKCPKIVQNVTSSTNVVSSRSKGNNTKMSIDQKIDLPQQNSKFQLPSAYGVANKKLQDFFHMTCVKKR